MSKLAIVESPAKAETIKEYLGSGYEVAASMGHVHDLQENRLNVDIKNDFKPKYEIIKGKERLVQKLKSATEKSESVLLVTDPDRRGKAISWHLAYTLNLSTALQNRITFNEIAKTGITDGMEHPRSIDLDLVNAQQARRILGRLVSYKLSPFPSQKIHHGLSAGRVQSVAVRLVVDREEEARTFVPEEYWSIDAKLILKGERKAFAVAFYGNTNGKIKIAGQQQADETLKSLEDAEFFVSKVKKGSHKKSSAPPFITSTLRQETSRKLGFRARRTMKTTRELCEDVEIEGMGAISLITYMRTDSLRISKDAIHDATAYIEERWGKKYLSDTPRHFKTETNAQDGYETTRPSTPSITPGQVKNSLTSDRCRLHKLIWEHSIACQMANCLQSATQTDITAREYLFKASGYTITFDGFTVLYEGGKDEEARQGGALPVLTQDMPLEKKELAGNQHFTQPPPRYAEASLIRTLEENGIGHPSTYAATISTITGRKCVVHDGKTLYPIELGKVVTWLTCERLPRVVNIKFTAQVEKDLDTVQSDGTDWVQALHNFYGDFGKALRKAKEDMEGVKIQLKEDETDVIREKCGRCMVVRMGRYGKFLACLGYPECKNVKRLVVENGVECPKRGDKVVMKKTKEGRVFYGCSEYPKCDFVSWDGLTMEKCPRCDKALLHKKEKTPKLYCVTLDCGYEKVRGQ